MLATLQPAPGPSDGGESGLLFLSVPPLRKLPDVFWVEPLGAVRWCGGHEDRGDRDSGGWQQRQSPLTQAVLVHVFSHILPCAGLHLVRLAPLVLKMVVSDRVS